MNTFKIFISCIIIFILVTSTFAQLKEFEIKELEPPPSIPVFINYPGDAALIIYSSLTNLYFESNMDAIVDDISTPQEGKYILIIREKTKQIITVKAKGFREGKIKVPKLNAKEVKYYQIEQLIIEGILAVQSTPEDAEVYINESLYGSTPYEGKFKKGTYEITLKKDMYHELIQTVEVISDTTMEYLFDLFLKFGTLSLTSEPTGAEVFLDGSLKGKTPIEIDKIPSGEHRLTLRKIPYKDVRQSFIIKDAEVTRDNIIMPKTDLSLNIEKRQLWSRRRNLTLIGSGSFAILGLGLKYIADSKFGEYNKVKSTDKAVNLRNQVENLDFYSTLAYIGSAVFGGCSVFNQFKIPKTKVDVSLKIKPKQVMASVTF